MCVHSLTKKIFFQVYKIFAKSILLNIPGGQHPEVAGAGHHGQAGSPGDLPGQDTPAEAEAWIRVLP